MRSLFMFHIAHDSLVQTHAKGRELYDHYTSLLDQYFRFRLEDPVYLDIVYRRVLLSPAACFPFVEGAYGYEWFLWDDTLCILHPEGNKQYIELFRNFILKGQEDLRPAVMFMQPSQST